MRYAYFLNGGVASLVAITEGGQSIDISMIGNEGFIGVPIILLNRNTHCRVMVQIPGDAMRVAAERLLSEFRRGAVLQQLLLRYTHTLQIQMAQSAVCHSLHGVSQRVARCLLTISDYLDSDSFELTQEDLALMLGHERSRVSLRSGELQKRRLLKYGRGQVTILDRKGLIAAACECYRIVKECIKNSLDLSGPSLFSSATTPSLR
jgi:CRP-like cAMP-binding protein